MFPADVMHGYQPPVRQESQGALQYYDGHFTEMTVGMLVGFRDGMYQGEVGLLEGTLGMGQEIGLSVVDINLITVDATQLHLFGNSSGYQPISEIGKAYQPHGWDHALGATMQRTGGIALSAASSGTADILYGLEEYNRTGDGRQLGRNMAPIAVGNLIGAKAFHHAGTNPKIPGTFQEWAQVGRQLWYDESGSVGRPGNGKGNLNQAPAVEKPNLVDAKGQKHILEGDGPRKGGGHRPGTGKPGKSEFPLDWSDAKILGEVSDITTDPTMIWTPPNRYGYISTIKTVDGVVVKVVFDTRTGRIVTGYPTNTPRNP